MIVFYLTKMFYSLSFIIEFNSYLLLFFEKLIMKKSFNPKKKGGRAHSK